MKKTKSKEPKFEPLGKWVAVKNDYGGQRTTDAGIVYTEKHAGRFVKSEVLMVGPDLTEDVKVGDTVYWDAKAYQKGNELDDMHIIHQDWIAVVDREE